MRHGAHSTRARVMARYARYTRARVTVMYPALAVVAFLLALAEAHPLAWLGLGFMWFVGVIADEVTYARLRKTMGWDQ